MFSVVSSIILSILGVLTAGPASGVAPSEATPPRFTVAVQAPPEVDLIVRVTGGAALRESLRRSGLGPEVTALLEEPALLEAWHDIATQLGVSHGALLDRLLGVDATFFAVGLGAWWEHADATTTRPSLEWAIATVVQPSDADLLLKGLGYKRRGGGWQELGAQRLQVAYLDDAGILLVGPSARPLLATSIRTLIVDGAGPRLGNTAPLVGASDVGAALHFGAGAARTTTSPNTTDPSRNADTSASAPRSTIEFFRRHDAFGTRWTACVAVVDGDVIRLHHRSSETGASGTGTVGRGAAAPDGVLVAANVDGIDAKLVDVLSDAGVRAVVESGAGRRVIAWMSRDALGLQGRDRDLLERQGDSATLVVMGDAESDSGSATPPMAIGLQIRDPIGAIEEDEERLAERMGEALLGSPMAPPLATTSVPDPTVAFTVDVGDVADPRRRTILIQVVRAPTGAWRVIANDSAMLLRTVTALERSGSAADARLLSGGTLDRDGLSAMLRGLLGGDGSAIPERGVASLPSALQRALRLAAGVESVQWKRTITTAGVGTRMGWTDTELEVSLRRAGSDPEPADVALPPGTGSVASDRAPIEPALRHDRHRRRR